MRYVPKSSGIMDIPGKAGFQQHCVEGGGANTHLETPGRASVCLHAEGKEPENKNTRATRNPGDGRTSGESEES